jgi:hypothetical protein
VKKALEEFFENTAAHVFTGSEKIHRLLDADGHDQWIRKSGRMVSDKNARTVGRNVFLSGNLNSFEITPKADARKKLQESVYHGV